ncbi:histidine kinase N-terminal 7TM domain-containing diguanylate cyclase [Metabacillus bambusae]|nr:histidine kinase N-terminal 7TM domain-containing protein [Metabacillus bambusae]
MMLLQELLIYILIIIIAGLLSVFLCGYAILKLKGAPGARYYMLVTFTSAIFTFAYAFELSSKTIEQIIFWLRIEYLALPFIPLFLLLMSLDYTGQKLKPWLSYILFIIPFITIFLHSTNDLHHFYYTSMELRADSPFPIIKLEGGPWYFVHSIFVFLCIMVSVIILLIQLNQQVLLRFRLQILTMVAGLLVPIIASYFYMNNISPYGIDLGPVSMSVSFLFHGAALLSFQMFNVSPIARDTVFASMKEGVIVLNHQDVIVDYNNSMKLILPMLNHFYIGKTITNVLKENQELANIIYLGKENDYEICIKEKKINYHIRFSPILTKNNQQLGKIISFVDITDQVYLQKKLKLLASMDGLTQVYNRTYFMRKTEKLLESLISTEGNVSIIMFDIDHFKKVNDTLGHDAGDHVLKYVVKVAKKCLRVTDIMGRFGGEEFIICLPNTSLYDAFELANTIRLNIAEKHMLINKKEICVTSSFGISHAMMNSGVHHQSIQTLIRQADEALYAAKRKGRNCVQQYTQVIQNIT